MGMMMVIVMVVMVIRWHEVVLQVATGLVEWMRLRMMVGLIVVVGTREQTVRLFLAELLVIIAVHTSGTCRATHANL